MHGIVMKAMKDFVVETYDAATWRAIQEDAGLGGKLYVPVSEYDDAEALALVAAATERSERSEAELLYAFGGYIVAPVGETYGVHVEGEWTGLDLLANVETYIHEALRAKRLSEFTPPELRAMRVSEDTAVVRYGSDRELCMLAEGIIDGVADHYGESYEIRHAPCQLEGGDHCDFVVERTTPQPAAD